MFIILAIDALEYDKVHEFDCEKLMQRYHGKTDISEFSQPRTMVLWSSFMTGENKESEVLLEGNREMWNKKWRPEETFFANFDNPVVIDLPGYSYDLEAHARSRSLLKEFFGKENGSEGKAAALKEYNSDAFSHHRSVKKKFLKALDSNEHDLILGYFSVVDVIGHLNFGKRTMMKILYGEIEDIYDEIVRRHPGVKILVLSDHGMVPIGMFGDHSEYGFWSTNFLDLGRPRITDLAKMIIEKTQRDDQLDVLN